jgi:hypothetical protein
MMKKMKTAVTSIPTARARSPGDVKNLRDPGPIYVDANYWHLIRWLDCTCWSSWLRLWMMMSTVLLRDCRPSQITVEMACDEG